MDYLVFWKDEFELFVTASGINDQKQQRALLFHLAGPDVLEIFRTISEETKGGAKKQKESDGVAQWSFQIEEDHSKDEIKLSGSDICTRRVNKKIVTRPSSLAEHCEYGEEKDSLSRDQVLAYIEEKIMSPIISVRELTLFKLLEVVRRSFWTN